MPAQTKDRTALIDAAADELRLTDASGDTLAAADSVKIDGYIDSLLSDLDARGIVSITDAEAIPITYFNWVAKLLAMAAEGAFGKPATPDQRREYIEDLLRVAVNSGEPTNRYLKVDRALVRRGPYTLLNFRNGT